MDENYTITYKYTFEFNGCLLAFRKKELFNITNTPTHIKRTEQGWWVNSKLLSPSKAQELITLKEIVKDITGLQWYQQINLTEVFNL